jgi:hypothetical protein
MPNNVMEIQLRTTISEGLECVSRTPPSIHARRSDVDVVRITNKNPPHTGSTITITLDEDTLGDVFQDPPEGPQDLTPGQSLDLEVRSDITSTQSEGFSTNPRRCHPHDSSDIVIQP